MILNAYKTKYERIKANELYLTSGSKSTALIKGKANTHKMVKANNNRTKKER